MLFLHQLSNLPFSLLIIHTGDLRYNTGRPERYGVLKPLQSVHPAADDTALAYVRRRQARLLGHSTSCFPFPDISQTRVFGAHRLRNVGIVSGFFPSPSMFTSLSFWLNIFFATTAVQAVTSYANDFVDPNFVAAGIYGSTTGAAQDTIVQWADQLSAYGPWSRCLSGLVIRH